MRALDPTAPTGPDRPGRTVSDVLVVGCGIIGAVATWRASCLGLSVTCLDPSPGAGATHAAAGMLAPVTEATFGEAGLVALCVESAVRWPGFAADLEQASGSSVDLHASGTLSVAYDRADADLAARLHALRTQLGLRSEEIGVEQAREREPFLGGRLAAAHWAPDDHQVDPRATHRALMSVIDGRAGMRSRVLRVAAARLLRSVTGDVVGVVDDAGTSHSAGLVVLAAGAASGSLLDAVPEVVVPTRGVRGHTIRLDARGTGVALRHVVRGTVQTRPVYVVPRPGGEVVVGATSDELTDDRAPAGGIHALLRDARALVPGIDEMDFREVTTGLRPGTPDNLPIVGPSGVPGLAVATGHHRNGVLLAPLTAAWIEELLSGSLPSVEGSPGATTASRLDVVDPRRFAPAGVAR